MRFLLFISVLTVSAFAGNEPLPSDQLILDLDAAKGLQLDDDGRVISWKNQAPIHKSLLFSIQNEGRAIAGSGRPSLRKSAANKKPALIFKQQELICPDEDIFDGLTTGKGHTWIAVIAVYDQRVGVKNVNSFFGNLRNGKIYEGLWGCLDDDNTIWCGARNGLSFGRFDKNNPKVSGPVLEREKFYIIAGRMDAGTGTVNITLHVNTPEVVATEKFPVNPKANPSRMAIGQERDAIEHPGKESFDGEIARFLIWQKPLSDKELASSMKALADTYLESD
ncbi:MAG: LamG-like jellyroll fold domain-containing protein [Akkermansiaceae bacterium]